MSISTDPNALTKRFPAFESVDFRRLFLSNSFTSAAAWMLIRQRNPQPDLLNTGRGD